MGTLEIGEVAERAVAGDVDEHVGDGDQEEVRGHRHRVGQRAVEQAQDALDVRLHQPLVRQEDQLLEAQQRPDVELRHVVPEHVRVAHIALASLHRLSLFLLNNLAQQHQGLQIPLSEVHAAQQPQHRAVVLDYQRRQLAAPDLPRRGLQRAVAQLPHRARAAAIDRREEQELGEQEQRAMQDAACLAGILDNARRNLDEIARHVVEKVALAHAGLVLKDVALLLEEVLRGIAGSEDGVVIGLQHERKHKMQKVGEGGLLCVVYRIEAEHETNPSCFVRDSRAPRSRFATAGGSSAARSGRA